MKKSDLKNGMMVELRNGYKYLVMKNCYCSAYPNGEDLLISEKDMHMDLQDYTEELKYSTWYNNDNNNKYDIIKVYKLEGINSILIFNSNSWQLIWNEINKED